MTYKPNRELESDITAEDGAKTITSNVGLKIERLDKDPVAPPLGSLLLYAIDDGSGTTKLRVMRSDGKTVDIA